MAEHASIEELLQDVSVDAASRALASMLYQAALRQGHPADEALDLAADALREMREQWEDAKRQDEAG